MDQNRIPAPVARHGDEATAAETPLLTPRLQASWKRSRRYGLTPEDLRPDFTGTVDTESLLYECGHEVLQGLKDTLAGEPVGMTLTNSDGLVLFRLCGDSSVSRSLDRVNLAPGFSFSESNAGTNGMGLALADRAPSLVRAEEHYCTLLRQYTCAAVPVLDPLTGELAGSVNLTTWSDRSSKLLLALAQAAAGNTAALMLARTTGRKPRPAPRGEVFQVFAHRARTGNPPPSSPHAGRTRSRKPVPPWPRAGSSPWWESRERASRPLRPSPGGRCGPGNAFCAPVPRCPATSRRG